MSTEAANLKPPFVLALDVGTSSTRALLYDGLGRAVEGVRAVRGYDQRTTPDGGAELDADFLLEAALGVIAGAAALCRERGLRISGVAVTTFWHGIMAVGADGKPLTPIYTWAEMRGGAEAERLKREHDEVAAHAKSGCLFHPCYWTAKINWLRTARPEVYRAAAGWRSFGEYLAARLFGRSVCSHSMASGTGVYDLDRRDWDDGLLALAGAARDQVSPIVDTDEPLRGLVPEYAALLPDLNGVPWYPAVGDGASSNVGCGCVVPERAALMVGTSAATRVMTEAAEVRVERGLWRYRLDGRRQLVGGALSNGGNLYAWINDTFRLGSPEEVEREIAALAPDAHGLTVLPFLYGERNPGYATRATASVVGLRARTRPVEVLRAALEAVAYRFALIYELLEPAAPRMREIFATGGGLLRSPAWTQIMADVLGHPVRVSLEQEASSRGAALVALEHLGAIGHLKDAPVELGDTYRPDPERHEIYRRALARHRELYGMLVNWPARD